MLTKKKSEENKISKYFRTNENQNKKEKSVYFFDLLKTFLFLQNLSEKKSQFTHSLNSLFLLTFIFFDCFKIIKNTASLILFTLENRYLVIFMFLAFLKYF